MAETFELFYKFDFSQNHCNSILVLFELEIYKVRSKSFQFNFLKSFFIIHIG